MRFMTRFSDEQIVDALRAVSVGGTGRQDAGDRLQPPNLCVFCNNLPRPERDRLLDAVYPAAPRAEWSEVIQALEERTADDAVEGEDVVEIRGARPGDLPGVAMVEAECFDASRGIEGHSVAALRQLLELAGGGFLVAQDRGGRILGYAVATAGADRTRAWLLSLAVRPEARGAGIGRELLRDVLEEVGRRDVTQVWATADPDDDAARRLLRSVGFADVRIARDYLGEGHDRVLMNWEARR